MTRGVGATGLTAVARRDADAAAAARGTRLRRRQAPDRRRQRRAHRPGKRNASHRTSPIARSRLTRDAYASLSAVGVRALGLQISPLLREHVEHGRSAKLVGLAHGLEVAPRQRSDSVLVQRATARRACSYRTRASATSNAAVSRAASARASAAVRAAVAAAIAPLLPIPQRQGDHRAGASGS